MLHRPVETASRSGHSEENLIPTSGCFSSLTPSKLPVMRIIGIIFVSLLSAAILIGAAENLLIKMKLLPKTAELIAIYDERTLTVEMRYWFIFKQVRNVRIRGVPSFKNDKACADSQRDWLRLATGHRKIWLVNMVDEKNSDTIIADVGVKAGPKGKVTKLAAVIKLMRPSTRRLFGPKPSEKIKRRYCK